MTQSLLKDLKKHYTHYLILFSGIFSGLTAFFALAGLPRLRILSVIAIGAFYVLWGTIHHLLDKDFHLRIFFEYFFIASLACAILLSLILRG